MDPIQTPSLTDGSTGNGTVSGQSSPTTPVANPPVNAAQSNVQPSQNNQQTNNANGQQNQPDITALVASWEQRNRNLMSEKDKALNERNQSIADQITMQGELTRIQTDAQATLATAASAAQQALDRVKLLETENLRLQRENMRSQLFREKPHLAEYGDFLPQTNDATELKTAAERLEQIRASDIERNKAQLAPSGVQTPSMFAPLNTPNAQNPTATAPLSVPGQPNANMFVNRSPNIPASSPSAMSPYGAVGDPLKAINDLYAAARASGKPEDFQRANEQAIALGTAHVQQQYTR